MDAGADPNAKYADGDTLLIREIRYSYDERPAALQLLLDAGADPNATDDFGRMPLYFTVANRNPEVAQALLNAGADPDATDEGGLPLLLLAAQYGNLAMTQALLDAGADPNTKNEFGETPMSVALATEDLALVQALLDAGADSNGVNRDSSKPGPQDAEQAASSDRPCPTGTAESEWVGAEFWRDADSNQVKSLLSCGVDANAGSNAGFSILHDAASFNDNPAVIQALLDAGANVEVKDDKDGKTPLHFAAGINGTQVIRALLDAGADLEATDDYGRTPLHYAVEDDDNPLMSALLAEGFSIETNRVPMIQTLLDAGADLEAEDKRGNMPLHYAAPLNKDPAVFQALLDAGADVNAKNGAGYTPLDVAELFGNSVAIELLSPPLSTNRHDKQ